MIVFSGEEVPERKGRKRKRSEPLEQELALCIVLKSVVCLGAWFPLGTQIHDHHFIDSHLQSVLCGKTVRCLSVTSKREPIFEKACFKCLDRRVLGTNMH